jgi:hypothetical protein
MAHAKKGRPAPPASSHRKKQPALLTILIAATAAGVLFVVHISIKSASHKDSLPAAATSAENSTSAMDSTTQRGWVARALAVSRKFHAVYTPCWEGAYGAMGDALLFAATRDSSLLQFHLVDHPLQAMCEGTWVDDRAWVCLAELDWWQVTGRTNMGLVMDAAKRYHEAKDQGRMSSHEGFWSWYNWPPRASVDERIFTNSNMNQMVTVACRLYEATTDKGYLKDAVLIWNGDKEHPGIEKTWYVGKGRWSGRPGHAAFGNELPWEGTGYCSVASALYHVTRDKRYRDIAIQTAERIFDPASGWVDAQDYYQLRMDGGGAFVHFLLDAYAIAPGDLADVPVKLERMLQHVWTNHQGTSSVTLHRLTDHGIRNGWNSNGGEEGYGVGEIGTVHAQGEAARAFGAFVYYRFHYPIPGNQE